MEACLLIEKDLENALAKFRGLGEHSERVLSDAITQIQNLKQELSEAPDDFILTPAQVELVRETVQRCNEIIYRLATEHRDAHAAVSRVGRAVERNLAAELGLVAPRAAALAGAANRRLAERAATAHLRRLGLHAAADALQRDARLDDKEERRDAAEPFAALQRATSALRNGDPGPALAWAEKHKDRLKHSPLPFALHRVAFLREARTNGPTAAVAYARKHFPALAARHEQELQRCLCLVAYEAAGAAPPAAYAWLARARGRSLRAAAAELFAREACALLRVAPLSALAGAVLAGARVLPALLDVRAKMTHPHAAAAWAQGDELPVEVDLSAEGGGHHSVFACPILRQQASDQNPPMRLLCGHVISRDALTKLAQGMKLKCPYCPMEQTQSEARLIYF